MMYRVSLKRYHIKRYVFSSSLLLVQKERGDFPGWKEINYQLPLNFAGNFLLLVTLKQPPKSAGSGKAAEEVSQLI